MKIRSTSRLASGAEGRSAAIAQASVQLKQATAATMPDVRAASLVQLQHQERASNSSQAARLKACADTMGKFAPVQRIDEKEPPQGKFDALQRMGAGTPLQGRFERASASDASVAREEKPNNTGLPNQLKSGIESLSGLSMDHVKVHYNSDKPAQLQAHAYAQGSEIHVAPGQEKHLPHEAWHVVQQAQGRVKPTMQMQAGVPVNDEVDLETEADQPIQRFIDVTGVERIDDPIEIDGFIKRIAPHNSDRKIWPQLQLVLRQQFAGNTTYASMEDLQSSLLDNDNLIDNLDDSGQANLEQYDDDTYGFTATIHGDLNREKPAKPKSITLGVDGLYRTNIHDPANANFALARGKYAFVKMLNEPLTFGKFGHEHLAKDNDVEYAGEATFNSGELLFWTNNSGHYKPDARAMDQAGLPMGKFVPLGFVEDDAVRLATRNTKNPVKIAALFGVTLDKITAAFNRLQIEKRGGGRWK